MELTIQVLRVLRLLIKARGLKLNRLTRGARNSIFFYFVKKLNIRLTYIINSYMICISDRERSRRDANDKKNNQLSETFS